MLASIKSAAAHASYAAAARASPRPSNAAAWICRPPPRRQSIRRPNPTEQHVYTDASYRGGMGVVWCDHAGSRVTLALKSSERDINCTELNAIFFGVLLSDSHKDLTVFTDSELSVKVLHEGIRSRKFQPLASCILTLVRARRGTTRFVKIKAHSGIPGNDRADALAKKAGWTGLALPWLPDDPTPPSLRTYLESCGIDPAITVLGTPEESQGVFGSPPRVCHGYPSFKSSCQSPFFKCSTYHSRVCQSPRAQVIAFSPADSKARTAGRW